MRLASRPQLGPRAAQRYSPRAPHRATATSSLAEGVPAATFNPPAEGVPAATDLSDAAVAALRRYRHSPKWDHLRDLDALEKHVGKIIELPDLRVRPKALTEDSLSSFLLTEQRFKLWKEISAGLQLGRPWTNTGLVLSGPHGVGKSHISYLAAAAAFVNSHIVGYWPQLGEIAMEAQQALRHYFFLRGLYALNKDLLRPIKLLHEVPFDANIKTMGELIECAFATPKRAPSVFSQVVAAFQEQVDRGVLYVVDEHNELFAHKVQRKTPFKLFTTLGGTLNGERTFLVIAGSAHSAFEDSLPSGLEVRLRYVRPPTRDEFHTMLAAEPFKNKPVFEKNSKDIIEALTGRVPCEITRAAAASDIVTFERDRVTEFSTRAGQLVTRAKQHERAEYLNFLEELLLLPVSLRKGVASLLYDRGLLYRDEHDVWQFLSRPAKDALTRIWAHYAHKDPIVTPGDSKSAVGAKFQKALFTAMVQLRNVSLFCMSANRATRSSFKQFNFLVEEVCHFSLATMSSDFKNPNRRAILYKPVSEVFGCWDFIIHNPSNTPDEEGWIGFFSLGIQVPSDHEKNNRFTKAFSPKQLVHYNCKDTEGRQRNQVEQILDALVGKAHTAVLSPAEDGSVGFDVKRNGKKLKNVHFFYASGAKETELAKDSIAFRDVNVFGRGTLRKLGLVWAKK